MATHAKSGWAELLATDDHPLARLQGMPAGRLSLAVHLGPSNRIGARYFRLFLRRPRGGNGAEPVLFGLANFGRYPAQNWIEVMGLCEAATNLFPALTSVLPPGGHVMVEYESPRWDATARALAWGVPPAATELGCLLRQAGCGAAFRDWYISEGWTEGPRKLQGFKALDAAYARQKDAELLGELRAFLDKSRAAEAPPFVPAARRRAEAIVKELARGSAAGLG